MTFAEFRNSDDNPGAEGALRHAKMIELYQLAAWNAALEEARSFIAARSDEYTATTKPTPFAETPRAEGQIIAALVSAMKA